VLTDGVITLRPPEQADLDAIYEACQDPEIQRWMPLIPRPYTRDDARAFVTGQLGLGDHNFAIVDDGHVVGSVGMRIDHRGNGEVGYWCATEARGRGLVTRALRLLCAHAFESVGLRRVWLTTDPDNRASQRVAEKAGFQREGVLRSHLKHPDGRVRDSVLYSLLPGDRV
jgi:RimJ/RimL family protein N-acetyltransferase